MRKIILLMVLIFGAFAYNTLNAAFEIYYFEEGTWTHSGSDMLWGDHIEKDIHYRYDWMTGKKYCDYYNVSCYGDQNYLCFIRSSDHISVGLMGPPTPDSELNGISSGEMN